MSMDSLSVSIHAPTWGATLSRSNFIFSGMFQSTHPHGVRHTPINDGSIFRHVSIHAPTWGATAVAFGYEPGDGRFQSTHPHGVRLVLKIAVGRQEVFQSTHPHGVRRPTSFCPPHRLCFNPRTHMGCDGLRFMPTAFPLMFQSTHPHGVRPALERDKHSSWYVSIHAPTWGATACNGGCY